MMYEFLATPLACCLFIVLAATIRFLPRIGRRDLSLLLPGAFWLAFAARLWSGGVASDPWAGVVGAILAGVEGVLLLAILVFRGRTAVVSLPRSMAGASLVALALVTAAVPWLPLAAASSSVYATGGLPWPSS